MLPANTNTAGGGCFQHPLFGKNVVSKSESPALPPDLKRNDRGITSMYTKKAYLVNLTATMDRSQFADMYMKPRFVTPYNLPGFIKGHAVGQGGMEHYPVSTIWQNDGALKINPKYVLTHKKTAFNIQWQSQ
jgi:hypothetical protein